MPCAILYQSCARSTELAFGSLIVLENVLHQLCKALGILIAATGYVTC